MTSFDLSNVLTAAIIGSIVGGIVITSIVLQYLRKKESLKAETTVRIEQIQAKNRLDIEMLRLENSKGYNQYALDEKKEHIDFSSNNTMLKNIEGNKDAYDKPL